MLTTQQKSKILTQFRVHDKDTGSPEAQVALFSEEIEKLAKHLKKHSKDNSSRVGVFVDVQNMYHSAKNLYGARVNFKELLRIAAANRELVRAVAYVVKTETEEEKAFFDALEKAGFELKIK